MLRTINMAKINSITAGNYFNKHMPLSFIFLFCANSKLLQTSTCTVGLKCAELEDEPSSLICGIYSN